MCHKEKVNMVKKTDEFKCSDNLLTPQAIQEVDENVSSLEQIWIN